MSWRGMPRSPCKGVSPLIGSSGKLEWRKVDRQLRARSDFNYATLFRANDIEPTTPSTARLIISGGGGAPKRNIGKREGAK